MTTVPARPPLARSSERLIAGVCSGLALHLGWPVKNVRIAMVLATLAGGAGLAFYAWLWIMVPTADEAARRNASRPASPIAPAVSPVAATAAALDPANGRAAAPWFRARSMRYGKEILLGSGLLLVAGIMIAQLLGVDVPLGTLIPAAAVLGGATIAWLQLD